jgi:hypothetical protein
MNRYREEKSYQCEHLDLVMTRMQVSGHGEARALHHNDGLLSSKLMASLLIR